MRRIATLLPAGLVLLAGAAFPNIVETIIGRDATWTAALYTWPALVVFVVAAGVAAAATLLARTWQWSHHRHDSPASIAAPEAPSAGRAANAACTPATRVLATSPSTS